MKNTQEQQQQLQSAKDFLNNSNNVHVIIRVRPQTENYQQNINQNQTANASIANILNNSNQTINPKRKCIVDIKEQRQILLPTANNGVEPFTFDYVGSEDVTQEDIFNVVGKPVVDQCLQGYNGSIFAYGQTGSGKTYTIQGINPGLYSKSEKQDAAKRGLLPRCFEYLFQQVCKIKNTHSQQSARGGTRSARKSCFGIPKLEENVRDIEVDIKCSYLEIYNEIIIDLLDSSQQKVQIRETSDGVYPEPCIEQPVSSLAEVMDVINRGARNRHVAATKMNNESSRSHAIFTASIKVIQHLETEQRIERTSKFHIVDLAGSERSKETGAEGQRLKEASKINNSLSTLSNVIYDLADISETKGKSKHVRYRDSKLTYLLKDSLGGNSKTVMICNVNPHIEALKETRCTLMFAQRAKVIKNAAVVNEENTSYKYWKAKYEKLVSFGRANTAPIPSLEKNNTFTHGLNKGSSKNQAADQEMGPEFKQLLVKAQESIRDLTLQLKEVTDQKEQIECVFKKANDEFKSSRASLDLALKLKENQLKVKYDKFLQLELQQKSNCDQDNLKAYIEQLQGELEQYKQEAEEKNKQISWGSLYHARTQQCNALETQVEQLKVELNKNQRGATLQEVLNKVLEQIDNSIAFIKDQNNHLKSSMKKEDFDEKMDIDSGDSMSVRYYGGYSQMDISALTQKREIEIANIKLQYEDQIESLRRLLKKEQSKSSNLRSIIDGTKQTQPAYPNDMDLLSSQIDPALLHYNTQLGPLLQSQHTFGDKHMTSSGVTNENLVEDMLVLMDDTGKSIKNRDLQINLFKEEIASLQEQLTEVTNNCENAQKENMDLKQKKLLLEDQVQDLTQCIAQFQDEVGDLYQQIQGFDKLQEEQENMKQNIARLEESNRVLEDTNLYFTANVIPEFNKQHQQLEKQHSTLISEINELRSQNQKLSELQTKDEQLMQLKGELERKTLDLNEKEKYMSQVNEEMNGMYEEIDRMNNHIKYQNDLIEQNYIPEIKSNKEEISQMSSQIEQYAIQIRELEKIMFDNEAVLKEQVINIQSHLQEIGYLKNFVQQEQEKFESQLRQVLSEKQQAEQNLSNKIEELEVLQNDLLGAQQAAVDESKKKEQFQQMLAKQFENGQIALTTIQNYRKSSSDKNQEQREQIKKLREDNELLRDQLREKSLQLLAHDKKIKQIEAMQENLTKTGSQLQQLRSMESEAYRLRVENQQYEDQLQMFESQLQIRQTAYNELLKRYDDLDRKQTEFINGGDSQKFQHFNQIKTQNNNNTKQLLQVQQELQKKRKEGEKLLEKYNEALALIKEFGEKICTSFNIPRPLPQCETQTKEYLQVISEIIIQGCTNQKLQLETPNAIPSFKQSPSGSISSSNNDSSQSQFNIFGNMNFNQNISNHSQLPNRQVNLNLGQENTNNTNTLFGGSSKMPPLNYCITQQAPNKQTQAKSIGGQTSSKNGKSLAFNFNKGSSNGAGRMTQQQNQTTIKGREPSNNRMDID